MMIQKSKESKPKARQMWVQTWLKVMNNTVWKVLQDLKESPTITEMQKPKTKKCAKTDSWQNTEQKAVGPPMCAKTLALFGVL